MSCLETLTRKTEVFCDLIRGSRPRPHVEWYDGPPKEHVVGPTRIELQLCRLSDPNYGRYIMELVEVHYNAPGQLTGIQKRP